MSHYFSIGSSRNKVEPYDDKMPEREREKENQSISQTTTSSERTKQLKKGGLNAHKDKPLLPLQTIGKAGKQEEWNCVSVSYPLEQIIKGFCFFDIVRAVFDTIIAISILVFIMGLEYDNESLRFAATTPNETEVFGGPLETRQIARIRFDGSKKLLAYALGVASMFYFTEVPLTVYLISSMRNRKKPQLVRFIQATVLIVISNWVFNIFFVVYCAKIGIIRNDILVTGPKDDQRKYLRTTSYCLVFRIAVYDLTKFAELIFVHGFMNENKRRVTWGLDQFNE